MDNMCLIVEAKNNQVLKPSSESDILCQNYEIQTFHSGYLRFSHILTYSKARYYYVTNYFMEIIFNKKEK